MGATFDTKIVTPARTVTTRRTFEKNSSTPKLLKNVILCTNPMQIVFFQLIHIIIHIFSSPEPKAQVSYCHPFLSVVRRPSCVVRRPSCVVRKLLHFHLFLQNGWLDFNQTWWESSLRGRDSKLFIWDMWPLRGPRGRALKGKKGANFKNLLLQNQKQ